MTTPGLSANGSRRLVLGLFALLLVLSAWTHDDAYITFRTVDNFVHGLGVTWNPAERVQAYTHPLWMFLNAGLYALTGEIYYTHLTLSIGLSLAAFYLLLFRLPASARAGVLAGFLLLAAKSFMDYSTSGLENPLTHLLLAAFALALARGADSPRNTFLLALIAALGGVNRLDSLLLFVPALAHTLYLQRSWRRLLAAALGFLPLVLWQLFALVYYGFLLPNTAYAKLGIGVSRGEFLTQGVRYLTDSLARDPTSLLLLAGVTGAAVVQRRRRPLLLLAGGWLYVGYVVWIGGDYMSGRFLSAPALSSALALVGLEVARPARRRLLAALLAVIVLVAYTAATPLGGPRIYAGVGDERQRFYHATGLLAGAFSDRPWPDHFFRHKGEAARRSGHDVVVDGYVGFLGFYAGPRVHVVDLLALPDPLLARIPGITGGSAGEPGASVWLPGHVSRPLPEGYVATLESGRNRLADPHLAAFYDKLRRVVRGELWSRERWVDIWRFHTGGYDHLVEAYVDAHPELFRDPPDDLRPLFTLDDDRLLR